MAKGDDEKKIELTHAQLKELIASEIKAAMATAAHAAGPSENEKFHAEIASRKGTDQPALPTSIVPGVRSADTGSTFDAFLDHRQCTRELLNYKEPVGVDRHQNEGGLVPNGHPIKEATGEYNVRYLQWRWESFLQADINALVGKPLPKHLIPAAA